MSIPSLFFRNVIVYSVQQDTGAVSYTHLRQLLREPSRRLRRKVRVSVVSFVLVKYVNAVSYTHLDVYKRQDLDLIISQKEATEYGVPIQIYF